MKGHPLVISLVAFTMLLFTQAAVWPNPQAVMNSSLANEPVQTSLVERGRYLVKIAGYNDCHIPLPKRSERLSHCRLSRERVEVRGHNNP